MNKKIDINEIKRRLKSILKNRISINNKTLIAFMIAGFLGLSEVVYSGLETVYIDYETGATGIQYNWNETNYWNKRNNKGNILLAPSKGNSEHVKKYNGINTNIENSVVIGLNSGAVNNERFMTVVGDGAIALKTGATALGAQANANDKGTAVGYGSKAIGSQGTALGNNAYAAGQGTALGSDVMAAGFSSIAIGNDDIKTKFTDKLPEETIMEIYGYKNTSGSDLITYKSILNEQQFKEKYGIVGSTDNRIYSPTYAAGVGAIAIGSRSVGYGNASLAMGTLSFALADRSTAVGVRAFVGLGADGATAIGDSSRVFASNSYAIGNSAESTAEGSLSFGSDAKAVGVGSIAIGPNVSSNAKLTDDSANKFKTKISTETSIGTVSEIDKWRDGTEINVTINGLKVGNDNEIVKSGFLANNRNGKNKITDLINNITTTTTGGKKENNKFSYEKEQNVEITTTEEIKKTKKEGDHSVSLGYHISNNGDNTIAIGTASYVRGANSVVLGALNNVGKYAINTVAIGVGTNVHKENSVAIGTGTTVVGAGVVAIGSGVGVTKDNTIALGYGTLGESSESVVLGNDAKLKTHSKKSIIIGNGAEVENKNKDEKISKKVGFDQEDYRSGKKELEMSAISIGTNSHVYSEKGIAFGDAAKVEENSANAMALGTSAQASAENAIAFGISATATEKGAMAFGNEANSSMLNSIALGYKSRTAYDGIDAKPFSPKGGISLPTSKNVGIISVGDKNFERRIVNVAAGAQDNDAVNVSQLKMLQERIDLMEETQKNNSIPYLGINGVTQTNNSSDAKSLHINLGKEKKL